MLHEYSLLHRKLNSVNELINGNKTSEQQRIYGFILGTEVFEKPYVLAHR
jgi:hypothetical protein